MNRSLFIVASIVLFLTCYITYASGNGNTPSGLPFIEIEGQIVEVQNSILDIEAEIEKLTGRVDSLEDRITANEKAISELESENAIISQKMGDLITQAAENSTDIADALNRMSELNQKISILEQDALTNATEIASLKGELETLNNYIASNVEGLLSLESQLGDNYTLIQALQEQIDEVNAALATKQDFINAVCPEGTTIRVINPDGSYECERATASGQFGLKLTYVYNMFTVPAGEYVSEQYVCGYYYQWDPELLQYVQVPRYCARSYWVYGYASGSATCPEGSLFESGGVYAPPAGVSLLQNSQAGNGWFVSVRSSAQTPADVYLWASCMEIYEITP